MSSSLIYLKKLYIPLTCCFLYLLARTQTTLQLKYAKQLLAKSLSSITHQTADVDAKSLETPHNKWGIIEIISGFTHQSSKTDKNGTGWFQAH